MIMHSNFWGRVGSQGEHLIYDLLFLNKGLRYYEYIYQSDGKSKDSTHVLCLRFSKA